MAETLTLRTATLADVAAVDTLLARSYPRLLKADYPPSIMVLALPLISRAQPHLLGSGSYYVVETEDGAVVGAGGWTPRRGGQVGDVRHLVTDDRMRRRGIGRTIMDHRFAKARAFGIRTLDCKSTRTAVPFYQSMGFVPLGAIEVPLAAGIVFPAIQMQRPI